MWKQQVILSDRIFSDQYIKVCNLPVMFTTNCSVQICSRHELPGFEFANEAQIYFLFSSTWCIGGLVLQSYFSTLCIVCKTREKWCIKCGMTNTMQYYFQVLCPLSHWGRMNHIHIIHIITLAFPLSMWKLQQQKKMLNDLSFFLTHTQAVALKGGNVSFELVLAEERWLTLMQNRRGGGKKRERD